MGGEWDKEEAGMTKEEMLSWTRRGLGPLRRSKSQDHAEKICLLFAAAPQQMEDMESRSNIRDGRCEEDGLAMKKRGKRRKRRKRRKRKEKKLVVITKHEHADIHEYVPMTQRRGASCHL